MLRIHQGKYLKIQLQFRSEDERQPMKPTLNHELLKELVAEGDNSDDGPDGRMQNWGKFSM